MTRAEGYRRQAEFCEQQAKQYPVVQVRQQFLLLARQWRELADHVRVVEQAQLNAARLSPRQNARIH
jgi:hypothetical protein